MEKKRFDLATATRNGKISAYLQIDGRYWELSATAERLSIVDIPWTTLGLLRDWDSVWPRLSEIAAHCQDHPDLSLDRDQLQLEVPIQWPGKVVCAGANYYDHMHEMGFPSITKKELRPFFFLKPPRQALVGPGARVLTPIGSAAFDWEIELVAVIGRGGKNIAEKNALSYVAAYTVGIDLTARDLTRHPEQFYKFDWLAGKAHDTSAPVGPRIVPSEFVKDPMCLAMKLWVNGVVKQDSSSRRMIFDIAEQISAISRIMSLEAGDLVFTGTPAGVGAPRKDFLSPGDVIRAEIEGLGDLTVTVDCGLPPAP